MFELVIRELGGLLGIFSLTGDQVFLDRAEELGGIVLETFDTRSGFPHREVRIPGFVIHSLQSSSSSFLEIK